MSPPRQRGRGGWGSSDWPDGFPPASKPIKVEGGLVARSTRGGIGEQWWSRRFLAVMESFALGTRLTRGRNYARQGQVISLGVEPGLVTAAVQGSRVTPYAVRIGLAVFSELVWAKAEVVLAEQAIHSARLLAGDFPPELEPVFAGIGAPLFPARLGDLTMSCSCPDGAVPCKHLAATFYLLAERFDDDPFLILRWRGRPREALLRRLRELRGDGGDRELGTAQAVPDSGPELDLSTYSVLSAAMVLPDTPEPAAGPAQLDTAATDLAFWTAGPVKPPPARPELPVDLLLRQLPVPGAALGGARLLAFLSPLYEQLPLSPPVPKAVRRDRRAPSRAQDATRRKGS